jgi:hypothetical protein
MLLVILKLEITRIKCEFYFMSDFISKALFLLNSIVMMYNLIIKKISYSHCIVIWIFLFLSCGQSNQFKNDTVRHVYNFADERNSEVLIEYLQNESDEIREHACLLFGSMNSNDAIGPLLKAVQTDKIAGVRKAAAFALGQYQQETLRDSLYKYFLIEDILKVSGEAR